MINDKLIEKTEEFFNNFDVIINFLSTMPVTKTIFFKIEKIDVKMKNLCIARQINSIPKR